MTNSKLLSQPVDFIEHKNGFKTIYLADIELECSVVVDDSHSKHRLWALTDHAVSNKILQYCMKLAKNVSVSKVLQLFLFLWWDDLIQKRNIKASGDLHYFMECYAINLTFYSNTVEKECAYQYFLLPYQ